MDLQGLLMCKHTNGYDQVDPISLWLFVLLTLAAFALAGDGISPDTPLDARRSIITPRPAGFHDAVVTIIAETRGQPVTGQLAVAYVIKNRIGAYKSWTDLSKVVRASGYSKKIKKRVFQFEPWQTRTAEMAQMRQRYPREYKRVARILSDALLERVSDPVARTCGKGRSFYFLNEQIVLNRYNKLPPFARRATKIKIGDHTFYCK